MYQNRKLSRPWLCTIIAILLMVVLSPFLLSCMVCTSTVGQMHTVDSLPSTYETIVILGCGIKDNGEPSDMLMDRLITGIALYQARVAPQILLSGDHEHDNYDEIAVMKRVCLEAGVPQEAILCDRYGLSTYDSLVRTKTQYGIHSAIVVTQTYHLYRALYIANKTGIEAVGVDADIRTYRLQWYREAREVLARCKDFYATQRGILPAYDVPG